MVIVVNCNSNPYNGEFDYALVDLSEEKMRQILSLRDSYKKLKETNKSLAYLPVWDTTPDFFNSSILSKQQIETVNEKDWLFFNGEIEDSYYEDKTDSEMLIVNNHGFYWRVNTLHGDGWVETKVISYDVLE